MLGGQGGGARSCEKEVEESKGIEWHPRKAVEGGGAASFSGGIIIYSIL